MGSVQGDNVNPGLVESPVDRVQVDNSAKAVQREAVERLYKLYSDYLMTPEGQTALSLVEHMRKSIDYKLGLTSVELGLTPEQAQEVRLILIGEKRVWTKLLTEPGNLKRLLDTLEGRPTELKTKKPFWRSVVD